MTQRLADDLRGLVRHDEIHLSLQRADAVPGLVYELAPDADNREENQDRQEPARQAPHQPWSGHP